MDLSDLVARNIRRAYDHISTGGKMPTTGVVPIIMIDEGCPLMQLEKRVIDSGNPTPTLDEITETIVGIVTEVTTIVGLGLSSYRPDAIGSYIFIVRLERPV